MRSGFREIHLIGDHTRERILGRGECPALARHGLLMVGVSDTASGYRFVRGAPDMCQVVAVAGGRGQVLVQGAWRDAVAGDVLLTPVGRPHGYRAGAGRWQLAWAMYAAPARGPAAVDGEARLVAGDAWAFATAVEGALRARSRADGELAHWLALLDHAGRRLARAGGRAARLEPVWRAVELDLRRRWTLAELARRAGVGIEQLRRLSLAETGRTPMRHVAWLRVARALALTRMTPLKLRAIADEVGFAHASALSVVCRRMTGLSPSEHLRADA